MNINEEIDRIMDNLILLCEVRGQLSPEANLVTEEKINELQETLLFLNTEVDVDKNFALLKVNCDL